MNALAAAFAVPFGLQAAAMLVDEGVYHRRRGLPRWERIGHPLDTLTVLACYAWLVAVRPTPSHAAVYAALAAFSCLFVTKDEPLHAKRCTPQEHWIHSVLFVLHPVVLGIAGFLWWTSRMHVVLVAQLIVIAAFGTYQLLYWNGPWQPRRASRAMR